MHLLHGFAQPPAAWSDVVAYLDDDVRLEVELCPTPGHDPAVPVGAGWEATIDALAARLPRDAVAVGYSFGARLALGLLARDAVAGVVLISVNPGLGDASARAARIDEDRTWAARLREVGVEAFLDEWEAQPLFLTQVRCPPERRQRRRALRRSLEAEPLADAMERLGLGAMPDLREALCARAARAHLVVGADDAKFRAIAAGLREQCPELAVEVIEESGHDPTIEAPEALALAIGRAVARLAPPAVEA
ncbi:MAG TPA: alpha/beta fold hydrolase [Kofleriaceae bacterium]|nr:alpha/beta fold hydrolase [Kofleriaceae bacterium]